MFEMSAQEKADLITKKLAQIADEINELRRDLVKSGLQDAPMNAYNAIDLVTRANRQMADLAAWLKFKNNTEGA